MSYAIKNGVYPTVEIIIADVAGSQPIGFIPVAKYPPSGPGKVQGACATHSIENICTHNTLVKTII